MSISFHTAKHYFRKAWKEHYNTPTYPVIDQDKSRQMSYYEWALHQPSSETHPNGLRLGYFRWEPSQPLSIRHAPYGTQFLNEKPSDVVYEPESTTTAATTTANTVEFNMEEHLKQFEDSRIMKNS